MSLPSLTEDIAIAALRDFFRGKPFVFLGTGMSCALDTRFGMPALRDALINGMQSRNLTPNQADEWTKVVSALRAGKDLENSLDRVNDHGLIQIITHITAEFVANLDKHFAYQIAEGRAEWPAIRLLKRLCDALPDSDPTLHVLTPNYDLLFEYACDHFSIQYTNGLFGGIERKQDWPSIDRALTERRKVRIGQKFRITEKLRKHLRLYKVHGSLNYFFHRNSVIQNDAWMWNPPSFAQRVLITPGLSKYQILQQFRRELIQSADDAIEKATHFLFLGYGFNDGHLEEYIKRKLITQASHGVIVTRDSNGRIADLLTEATNLWLVCKADGEDGTRISNRRYANPLSLPNQPLWDVRNFANRILGE